ncbi:MAG: flagellar biosynthesis protein FlhB [Zetaproteobacteria bacterium]|nr:MAG: flagellar biosynthesis protein FlhB [Zetaproteobacteria bacterium]
MAEDQTDDSQKTEDPTPKKLEESRKRGQIALSREVNNWVMLCTGTIFIVAFSGPMMSQLADMMRVYIEFSHALPGMPGGLSVVLGEGVKKVFSIILLPLMLFMFAAFAAPFLQIGPLFAPEVIKPDWSKISIKKGFGRLFSMRSVVELIKGVVKICIVGLIAIIIISPYYSGFEHFIDIPITAVMEELRFLVIQMMVGVLIVLMVVAMMDLLYQRFEYNKKMRMSRQEIKDEYKQSEGDPHVKAKLRQLRSEKARQRMMQAVPSADVVITNPTHYSIALKYNPEEMPAPKVVAMGIDETALRIRELAKEHDIILYENKPLARALYDVAEIDEMIPMEHFKAVAEIISYVFKLKGRLN